MVVPAVATRSWGVGGSWPSGRLSCRGRSNVRRAWTFPLGHKCCPWCLLRPSGLVEASCCPSPPPSRSRRRCSRTSSAAILTSLKRRCPLNFSTHLSVVPWYIFLVDLSVDTLFMSLKHFSLKSANIQFWTSDLSCWKQKILPIVPQTLSQNQP